MRINLLILVILHSLFSGLVSAQVLTKVHHLPLTNDSLYAYKLPHIEMNDSGKNGIWDVSHLSLDSATIVDICYFAPTKTNTTSIGMHRERSNYYYNIMNDTLWMTGYESSQMTMRFDNSIPVVSFPFTYGNSISRAFEGSGQYCHTLPVRINGLLEIKADAVGSLVLPGMTIDSVLRVHTQIKYKDKSEKHYLVQEDSYQWYSLYCRYPLLETKKVQSFNGNDTILFAATYYYPQEQENIPYRKNIITKAESIKADSLVSNIHFMPNPVFSDVQIKYSLVHSARVYISLHYNGGLTTYQTPINQEQAGNHSVSVNMSGMPTGSYVVYIHADNIVASGSLLKL